MGSTVQLSRVTEIVERDKNWKCAGYRVVPVNMGLGDGYGHSHFLAEYLTESYKIVPMDWQDGITGCPNLQERFVYTARTNTWARELRKVEVS